tara:strand:- start:115 stop:801 length:687 start_codon:yes stop_codon:yes gene_type:complete
MFLFKYIIFLLLFLNNIKINDGFNININRRNLFKKTLLMSSNINFQNNQEEEEEATIGRIDNDIYFTGSLNDNSCLKLTQTLIGYKKYIKNKEVDIDKINLYIQSPGGSLFSTLGLIDEIKNYDIPINTYIKGYAASAATLLSVVGKERYMYNHSLLMIHGVKLTGSVNTLTDVRDLNDNVELYMDIIKNIYLENSNMTEEELEYYFIRDKWMTAKQALHYGLIDKIL